MEKGRITGLAHVGIFVKDYEKSVDFYQRLGFVLDKEEKTTIRLAFMSAGSCLIELVEKSDFPQRAAGPIDHLAITVDDIDAAVKNALAKGITIDPAAVNQMDIMGGIKNVFFEGPDGERLEFFEYCQ